DRRFPGSRARAPLRPVRWRPALHSPYPARARRGWSVYAHTTCGRRCVMPGLPSGFGGIVPPVCTPMTEDFEVDTASLERLIGFLLDAGVHGLFMLGSTSEMALLTDRQRATVLDVAVRTTGGKVPVLA